MLDVLTRIAGTRPHYPYVYRHEIVKAIAGTSLLPPVDPVRLAALVSHHLQHLRSLGLADCGGSGGAWSPTHHAGHLRA